MRALLFAIVGAIIITAAAVMPDVPSFVRAQSSRTISEELERLLQARAHESSDPQLLVKLSALYLDAGKEVYTVEARRRAAYEEGARLAKRALEMQETNADAHYLYAANLGSATQLRGLAASALTVGELKSHVARALKLQPDHPPALHMMGRMLDELPWLLGGDAGAALTYLKRAVAADPRYEHARLDLAKAYLKRKDRESARRELHTLVETSRSSHAQSASRYLVEGKSLLASLNERTER